MSLKASIEAIRAISQFSADTVKSANEVSLSLEQQMQSADSLEKEARHLEQNMDELKRAVAGFKLTEEEICDEVGNNKEEMKI